ncbi:MAG: DUF2752 domain-containing protein [Spirochaetaceae bacterium]|nr:DUF2752 domain-containing protein [Spirochaetaceae bacterium]
MRNNRTDLSLRASWTADMRCRKFFAVIVLGLLFYCVPKSYMDGGFPLCLFRLLLNKECPGCGTTRAVWSAMHLKFNQAYEYNKMIVLSFPLLAGCITKWILIKK